MQKLVLSDNLLIAHPRQPSGHTWTYTNVLGDALNIAQKSNDVSNRILSASL